MYVWLWEGGGGGGSSFEVLIVYTVFYMFFSGLRKVSHF